MTDAAAAGGRAASGARGFLRQREASVALMIVAVIVFLTFANEFFLTPRNLLNVGRQASVVAIVALGQALVIISRGLDLSVGSVLGLSAVAAAWVARASGVQELGLLAGLATGAFVGAINGGLFARLNINPFIATLGTLSIARGVALLITGGIPIPLSGGLAEFLGAGRIYTVPVSLILMVPARHRLSRLRVTDADRAQHLRDRRQPDGGAAARASTSRGRGCSSTWSAGCSRGSGGSSSPATSRAPTPTSGAATSST